MFKEQIRKYMYENASVIAGFVSKMMQYEIEDTGESLKLKGKMGGVVAFELEVDDSTARKYIRRILSGEEK